MGPKDVESLARCTEADSQRANPLTQGSQPFFCVLAVVFGGCGSKQKLPLDERTYRCPECGLIINRDHNATRNIEQEGLHQLGMESPEVTPAEIETSTQAMLAFFQNFPFVCASSVKEPGRLTALV
jgi:hypothetical protein